MTDTLNIQPGDTILVRMKVQGRSNLHGSVIVNHHGRQIGIFRDEIAEVLSAPREIKVGDVVQGKHDHNSKATVIGVLDGDLWLQDVEFGVRWTEPVEDWELA